MSNIDSGSLQATYWLGSISRKEAQGVYDEFATSIGTLTGIVLKLDAAVAFLFEKYNIDPAELQEWIAAKTSEAEASAPSPILEP